MASCACFRICGHASAKKAALVSLQLKQLNCCNSIGGLPFGTRLIFSFLQSRHSRAGGSRAAVVATAARRFWPSEAATSIGDTCDWIGI
jgi:hypothetical protein